MIDPEYDYEAVAPSEDAVHQLTRMAQSQVALAAEIEEIEATLKSKKADLRRLSWDQVPELMQSLGLQEIKLALLISGIVNVTNCPA